MAKKKYNFLLNTETVKELRHLAVDMGKQPSHLFEEAMQLLLEKYKKK